MNKPSAVAVKNIKFALSDATHPAWQALDVTFNNRIKVDAAALTNEWNNWMTWLEIAGFVKSTRGAAGTSYTRTSKTFDQLLDEV